MTAELKLAGSEVNAYGTDIHDLVLEVEYQSEHSKPISRSQDDANVGQGYMSIFGMLPTSNIRSRKSNFLDQRAKSRNLENSNSTSKKTHSHSGSLVLPAKSCSTL